MKKRLLIIFAAMLLSLAIFLPGATAQENDTEYPKLGLKIALSDEASGLGISVVEEEDNLLVVYTGDDGIGIVIASVYRIAEQQYTPLITDDEFIAFAEKNRLTKLGVNEGYVYLLTSLADFEETIDYYADALADEQSMSMLTPYLDALEECKKALPAITDSIAFIPIEIPELKIPEFTVQDIYGNEYTQDLFSQKDLTVVNIWGTFCGPCVNEMPELGQWSREMPDNVQIIGLVSDVYGPEDTFNMETARQIAETTGADFPHLIPYPGLETLLGISQYVPTTVFVDREGKIVGEPVVGAYVQKYKQFVEDYLSGLEK